MREHNVPAPRTGEGPGVGWLGRIERRGDHWLWRRGPVPPGSAGITLGPLIIVRSATPSARLLRHEEVHVDQWRRLGVFGFVRRYLGAYLRWRLLGYPHLAAYRRIPLEVEATWRSRPGVPATDAPG